MADDTGIEWTDETFHCWGCKQSLPRAEFGADRSRADGRNPVCKGCKNIRARERHVRVEIKRTVLGRRVPRRDGDRKQARSRVNHDIAAGLRPNPNIVPCFDCGHLGSDRRHEYDHHLGYAAEHHGDVQAVCSKCHHARERARRVA